MRSLILAALLLAPAPALAHDFNCRNEAAEIRCDSGACEVETNSFTPMGLTRRGGTLSICAYSGCSEGPILMRRTRGGIELLYAEVRLTRLGKREADSIAVIYDRAQQTAQMRWGGFSNAMTCG
ncbi:MAG: hypothetical protein V4574_08870 [Pseudomonadota bacterium]